MNIYRKCGSIYFAFITYLSPHNISMSRLNSGNHFDTEQPWRLFKITFDYPPYSTNDKMFYYPLYKEGKVVGGGGGDVLGGVGKDSFV